MAERKNIPFHVPFTGGNEMPYFTDLLRDHDFAAKGLMPQVRRELLAITGASHVELMSSCTHALEAALMALDLEAEDEVIVPSFVYMSAANAVLRAGARLVFADIDRQTMNLDFASLKSSLTPRTKAVIYMHYAGLSNDFLEIVEYCRHNGLALIEDAAHCIGAKLDGRHLGTFGDFGALSFHHTKNLHCGEGGALILEHKFASKIDLIIEKGTDKRAFDRGEVDAYDWQTIGSSFSLASPALAVLKGQLKKLEGVTKGRRAIWKMYWDGLASLSDSRIELPLREAIEEGNGHIFYIKTRDIEERAALIDFMKAAGVSVQFHYPALHASPAAKKYVGGAASCPAAASESRRLLRLPIYPELGVSDVNFVIEKIQEFYDRY